jgi:hypothetical protein
MECQKMTDRMITLPAELVERLEMLAQAQGRSIDEVFGELIEQYSPSPTGNWALIVAEGMEAADIAWQDDSDASTYSRESFKQHLREK